MRSLPISSARAALALALAALATLAACSGDEPGLPEPPAPGVALEIDGLRVTRAEIEAFYPYFDSIDPNMGQAYRVRELLDQHLIPLKLAQRAFAAERAALRERAEALHAAAGNAIELERKGRLADGAATTEPMTRNAFPLPVARFLFDVENYGRVSPPIEVARGFVLITPREIRPALTADGDIATAFVVPFYTHPVDEFDRWLREARAALAGRVTYAHPEFAGALPPFLNP